MEQLKISCAKCGCIDYAQLTFAGPHIKASCLHCGSYSKFIDKSLIPDSRETKMKIMVLSDSNIELINQKKQELGIFYNGISGIDEKIAYYRLFLSLRKIN